MVTIYYTEDGGIYAPTSMRGVKPDHHANLSPLKDRLTENNEKNVVENGVDADQTMVTGKADSDTNKYLHKKFKKVATLEETSPPKVKSDDESQPGSPGAGRYVCPYCKLACAKPSVLQKHIRAHTNERPFPCLPCGFAFKTKSNLYKHCRSRAHTLKIDDGSSEEEDTSKTETNMTAAYDVSNESAKNKIYKPKFRSATLYAAEEQQPKLQLSIPSSGLNSTQSTPSPFTSGSSPSPEFLQRHISKLISDNQAIVDEVFWPLKPKHKDSPPPSPALKNGDSDVVPQSKLALALLKPQRPITPEVGEPLNLTIKEPRKRSISESVIRVDGKVENSIIKDILLKSHSAGSLDARERETVDLFLCPNCKASFKTSENLELHLRHCHDVKEISSVAMVSPGPLLGNTPLVEAFQKDAEPLLKRRKLDNWLMKDDLIKSPGKSVHLFGGEVQIHDAGKMKTLRIEPTRKDSYIEQCVKKPEQVLTISKTGLHCAGGTILHTATSSPKSPVQEKLVLPIKTNIVTPTLSVPGLVAPVQVPLALNPLTSITAFNPLTLPKASPTNGGLVTILHAGKPIPYVPGMPGPHSVLPLQPPSVPKKPEKPSVIVTSIRSIKSPDLVIKTTPSIRVDVEEQRIIDEPKPVSSPRESTSTASPEMGEKRFLRPTSLPLKPGTYTPKRNPTTPHLTLISPETPRPRKSYGQLYLNGHAYTYLGLKCSTRTFFCTLNKPQPIYVPLIPDQYNVSMYSNWKICSDSNPHPLGLNPKKAMSLYDSRNRPSTYTVANRNKDDIMTHSTYQLKKDQRDSKSDSEEKNDSSEGGNPKQPRVKVCEGGFESNEEYVYVRGRAGRGRYVCEECGIRCKKPSMLKKHIRTHTDLRPYTCKHCAFSFKTKGNLTKHMKSKAHYKKCVELGIFPVPVSCDDSLDDDNETRKDEGTEGVDEESEDETDEDEDEDDDEDESEDEEGDECRTEREVARSLLSLSEVTLETAHRQYVKAGLVSAISRPRTYPYTLSSTQVVETKLDNGMKGDSWRGSSEYVSSDSKDFSDSSMGSVESAPDVVRPIDLSSKTPPTRPQGPKTSLTNVITSVGGQALFLKTICSTTEKAPLVGGGLTEPGENPTLLQTYLTERAAHDSRIKQRQVCTDDVTIGGDMMGAKESALGVLAMTMSGKPPSPKAKGRAEFMPPATGPSVSFISSTEDGRSMCGVCNKVFNKPSQLRLHVNIHYFERPFRCDSCAVSFRTKGHLQKHQRSLSHLNKVNMNSTFGTATSSNPRPFKCDDCKIAFRIHGHLAKHLRSKMHIMKLECLGKLPFGTYAELERSGMNMNDIDTTDCENSLESLQVLAQKLYEKDPSKLGSWEHPGGESSSEDEPDNQQKTDPPQAAKNQNVCQLIDGKECNETDDSLR